LTADTAVKLALLNNAEFQAAFEELGMARGDLIRALPAEPVGRGRVAIC
jgi:hypothetical protein